MEKSKNTKNEIWDTVFSTYWWIIDLDRKNSLNKPDVQPMHGYSKQINRSEATNRIYLLQKRIQMLLNHGYHLRSHSIKISMKTAIAINKRIDPLVVTLYPTDFSINPSMIGKRVYLPLSLYLHHLYQCLNSHRDTSHLTPAKRDTYSKDDYLNLTKFFFQSIGDLDVYLARLYHDGFPADQLKEFKRKYLVKYPHLEPSGDQVPNKNDAKKRQVDNLMDSFTTQSATKGNETGSIL